MRIWIDGHPAGCTQRVFHMSLIERLLRSFTLCETGIRSLKSAEKRLGAVVHSEAVLRSLARSRMRPTEILVSLPDGTPEPDWIPAELLRRLPVRFVPEAGSVRERLDRALRDAGEEAVLAFPGDAVVDVRIFEHLCWWRGGPVAFLGGDGVPSAVLRLQGPLSEEPAPREAELVDLARTEIDRGRVKPIGPNDVAGYLTKLRRHLAPYLIRIADEADARRAERFLFESNYKGSTDFMTKYVYPPLVWRALGPLTRHRVPPNAVTAVSILATILAVPLFAAGWWVPGLVCAYVMSVLDSVDGKLARVTFSSSEHGDVLDHGLDIVHPPFWYWAWAWGLSGGHAGSPVFIASMWMAGFYILDRIMETVFKGIAGRSIHGYERIDERMRTFISRRNVNLPIFTVALIFGLGIPAFYFIVAWQAFTLLFHAARVFQVWKAKAASTAG